MSRMPFLRPHAALRLRATTTTTTTRPLHATALCAAKPPKHPKPEGGPDALAHRAKGGTGDGQPLASTSSNASPQPKISNLSVPGTDAGQELTDEQKRDVDQHNRDFAKKHDNGNDAPNDKVDKKYWSGKTQDRP